MITKTVLLPNSKNPTLEAEVTRAGDVVECFVFIPVFDVWVDGMEMLKNRPGKIDEIRQKAADLNWNDHGDDDWALEQVKEVLKAGIA